MHDPGSHYQHADLAGRARVAFSGVPRTVALQDMA